MSTFGKNLAVFKKSMENHDKVNDHKGWGIGLAYFDLERMGLEEGEELWSGVTVHSDGKTAGNFRILCECEGDKPKSEEEEVTDAFSRKGLVFV